jgi:hypothetical protein
MSETTKGYEPLIDCTQPTPHRLAALGGLVCSAGLWGARMSELVPDEGSMVTCTSPRVLVSRGWD